MPAQFADVIKNLPKKPGVYRFLSSDGVALYVGKAKNLKNRVSSYFQEGRPKNQRLTLMISQIEQVEYTVVSSEKEALILEANLIHNLQPKYNVLLKDDRSYIYVRITNDEIPGIFLTRRKFDTQSTYFGPYTQTSSIYQIIRTLRMIFPFCQEKKPQPRPCSYVGIHQCDGICVGNETMAQYLTKIEQIKQVLSGNTEKVKQWLGENIRQSAEVGNFQLAALWRDRLALLDNTIANQKIILPQPQDIDLVTMVIQQSAEDLQIASVFVQNIRQGKMINVNNFLLSGSEEGFDGEAIEQHFLRRFFSSIQDKQVTTVETFVQIFKQEEQ